MAADDKDSSEKKRPSKMKKPNQSPSANANEPTEDEKYKKAPHSFVFHRGKVGRSILSLIRDMRRLMEPYTATKLKAGKKNVLKDFVAVAGPLGVSHLMIFTRNDEHINLRLIRLPRGPTLTFRVDGYTLSRDVISSLKKPSGNQGEFRQHPLIVMNNFKLKPSESENSDNNGRQIPLMQTTLQNMFPSININTVKLKDIRRCVMFNYDRENDLVECRHYSIKVAPTGLSRSAKKLLPTKRKIPDLGRYKDMSEYFLKPGQLSESEFEGDGQNEVELPQEMPGRAGCERLSQAAVRLTELGPRLSLQLIKVENGIADGEVLYHKFIKKSAKQVSKQRKKLAEKRKLKEARRQKQEENVKRKRKMEENKNKNKKNVKRELDDSKDDEYLVDHFSEDAGAEEDPTSEKKPKKMKSPSGQMNKKTKKIISSKVHKLRK